MSILNKTFGIVAVLLFLLSCNKEKASLRNLTGEWEITKYSEVIFDGTTDLFRLEAGSASFGQDGKSNTGTVQINWLAKNDKDTSQIDFDGDYKQIELRTLQFNSGTIQYDCHFVRQLKKDMTIEMVINPNRKSVLVLKKK